MQLPFFLVVVSVLAAPTIALILTTAAAGTTTAVTIGLATGTTAVNTALATVGVGAAAVVGALAAGALLEGHTRHKRDVSDRCGVFDNQELLFVLAANSDQLGCGQRLVCELEASEDASLNEVEHAILDLFGRNVKPLKASQMINAKSLYHYAAQVGSKASSTLECAEVFDLCPLDRAAIMEAYNKFAHATAIDQ